MFVTNVYFTHLYVRREDIERHIVSRYRESRESFVFPPLCFVIFSVLCIFSFLSFFFFSFSFFFANYIAAKWTTISLRTWKHFQIRLQEPYLWLKMKRLDYEKCNGERKTYERAFELHRTGRFGSGCVAHDYLSRACISTRALTLATVRSTHTRRVASFFFSRCPFPLWCTPPVLRTRRTCSFFTTLT